jgi:UrcA family protein
MWKAIFASAAVLCVVIASPASAQQPRHVHATQYDTYQVDFRDLDLTARDDRAELMGRLISAGQLVCSQEDEMTRGEYKRCVRAAVANALADAPAPVQVARRYEPAFALAER